MIDLVNLDAERSIIGAVLSHPDSIADVADWLPAEAFGDPRCRWVYAAMLRLWTKQPRVPADHVTLPKELLAMGGKSEGAALAFIAEVRAEYHPGAYVTYHAEIVLELARRRSLVDQGAALVKVAYEVEPNLDETLAEIRRSVEAFQPVKSTPATISEQVDAFRDLTLRRWDGEHVERVVTTGIPMFDRMISGGMRPEELVVVGARPSMGKTALMLHMARQSRSLVFSLEMPERQILNRLISAEAGVSFEVAMSLVGDLAQRDRWLAASERVATWPVTIIDTPGMTTARIEAIVQRQQAERPIDAVYIDHLGYLGDQFRHTNEQEKTGELIRRCKLLARRCQVPVVVLSQLNREVESRPTCLPYMSDIRSSGKVEEDADVVGLMFRRRYYVAKGMVAEKVEEDWITGTSWERVVINVAKNRNGNTGGVELGWEAAAMRLHDVSERWAA